MHLIEVVAQQRNENRDYAGGKRLPADAEQLRVGLRVKIGTQALLEKARDREVKDVEAVTIICRRNAGWGG